MAFDSLPKTSSFSPLKVFWKTSKFPHSRDTFELSNFQAPNELRESSTPKAAVVSIEMKMDGEPLKQNTINAIRYLDLSRC